MMRSSGYTRLALRSRARRVERWREKLRQNDLVSAVALGRASG